MCKIMDVEKNDLSTERVVLMERTQSKAFKTAMTSIMAALTCVVTMGFTIYTPATHGYFNVGEAIVYLSAILFGPYIGALSGGIGSMFSDLLSGYPIYAPGTLLIKGLEGFIVGYLYQRLTREKTENTQKKNRTNYWIFLAIFIASAIIFYTLVRMNINNINYSGLSFGWLWTLPKELGGTFWVLLEVVAVIIILIVVFVKVFKPTLSAKLISMFIGGCIMVLGYFLYETPLYSAGAASVEIPINFLQCIVGILVAVPLSTPIKKAIRI